MSRLQALLDEGAREGVFPSARALVLHRGQRIFEGGAAASPDTLFDLASLTKIVATTACFLSLWEKGRVAPDVPLSKWLPDSAAAKAGITLEDLLRHRSGLPAFIPFFATAAKEFPRIFEANCPAMLREEASRRVLELVKATALEKPPRTAAVYSDPGFILLAAALERAAALPLDELYNSTVAAPLGLAARFRRLSLQPKLPERLAATGSTRPREPAPGQEGLWNVKPHPTQPGEVDDDNAWVLDGVAGHSGLFGTAEDLARFGQAILDGLSGRSELASRAKWEALVQVDSLTPGSTRAMGFDTPSATGSSAGDRLGKLAPGAVGHLGFTGTSLWVDLHRQLVVALLTNRVALGRANDAIRRFRPRFHELVIDELQLA